MDRSCYSGLRIFQNKLLSREHQYIFGGPPLFTGVTITKHWDNIRIPAFISKWLPWKLLESNDTDHFSCNRGYLCWESYDVSFVSKPFYTLPAGCYFQVILNPYLVLKVGLSGQMHNCSNSIVFALASFRIYCRASPDGGEKWRVSVKTTEINKYETPHVAS